MAFTLSDRTKQTTTTTGTGSYTLISPAPTGFQDFDIGVGNGNSCYYCAVAGNDWEIGTGTVTSGATIVLSRSVFRSTNSDAAVVWGTGTKEVFVVSPADALNALRTTGTNGSLVLTGGGNTITLDPAGVSAVQGGLDITGGLTADSILVGGVAPVLSSRQVVSGAGLTGGGDLSLDRTLAVGAGTGITVNADDVALDTLSTRNTDHAGVSVVAGAGMTGGGAISASVTLNVIAGDGITVNANDVQVNATVVRTSGAQTIAGLKEFSTRPQTGGVNHALISDISAFVTYAGYVDTAAAAAVLPAGWTAVRNSVGNYTVTHNLGLVGATNLSVVFSVVAVANSSVLFAGSTINSFTYYTTNAAQSAFQDVAVTFIAQRNV